MHHTYPVFVILSTLLLLLFISAWTHAKGVDKPTEEELTNRFISFREELSALAKGYDDIELPGLLTLYKLLGAMHSNDWDAISQLDSCTPSSYPRSSTLLKRPRMNVNDEEL